VSLLQRILREKRATIVPLLVALAVNVAAYVLVVRPMGSIRQRSRQGRAATTNLAAAERDNAAANALITGARDAAGRSPPSTTSARPTRRRPGA
jgi:hypothetical protein